MSDMDNIVNPGDNFVEHGYCVLTDVNNRYKQLIANFDCALGLSAHDELEDAEFDFDAGFGCCNQVDGGYRIYLLVVMLLGVLSPERRAVLMQAAEDLSSGKVERITADELTAMLQAAGGNQS